jgi:monoterpene epsilon-lactone hydrolase
MASQESAQVRAGLTRTAEAVAVPIDEQRREWEDSAAQATLPPNTYIVPVSADGIHCERISCPPVDPAKLMVLLHGGGFSTGSCKTHREMAARISLAAKIPVLVVDYSLAPENPFPAAVDDVVRVYKWLTKVDAMRPSRIVLAGDSAGGGLAIQVLLALREAGEVLPGAVVLMSPWLDLSMSGESMESRAGVDPMTTRNDLLSAAKLYIGDRDPKDPRISPVFADLHKLPPTLIQVGDHEVLLSDAVRFAERAKAAGVEVTLDVWPEMWHVFQGWAATLPEAQAALSKISEFAHQKLRV